MQCRWKISPIGSVRKVAPVPFGYPLPEGLPEGATVKLLSFDHGYYKVDYEGRVFEVFMMCVCHASEMLLDGKWLPEDHPEVLIAKQRQRASGQIANSTLDHP